MARATTGEIPSSRAGLEYWAHRVLVETDKVGSHFDPDAVHDLRVALRRCRSMADGFVLIDPDPGWKQLKRLGKTLFSRLGTLRDVQVMVDWVSRLGQSDDPVRKSLLDSLATEEQQLKKDAQEAILRFDRKEWGMLAQKLAQRGQRVPLEGVVFQDLAVERWVDAYHLHRRALRNRSQVAFHQLRIGLKKFRYTVENFLPQRHARWGKDLRELQDLLGEVHDLDVLWTILRGRHDFSHEQRLHWRKKIKEERQQRLAKYCHRMAGPHTLWRVWRAQLPIKDALENAGVARLRTWASFLDPDIEHSQLVTRLALQLHDGLVRDRILHPGRNTRRILEAAALLHDVGRARAKQGHHKDSYRLIRRIVPPVGWTLQDLRAVAAVARYHCGALPRSAHKCLAQLPPSRRSGIIRLAGILRLANAFDLSHERKVRRLHVGKHDGVLIVRGEGYDEAGPTAERLAAARYLLEVNCHMPILVRSWTPIHK
ncbi:MAG TPA: CHAD domain-containing protein [Terriglobales bacterium]|nr:CHAD domain-containing protein [Terriglobales bacterium]